MSEGWPTFAPGQPRSHPTETGLPPAGMGQAAAALRHHGGVERGRDSGTGCKATRGVAEKPGPRIAPLVLWPEAAGSLR